MCRFITGTGKRLHLLNYKQSDDSYSVLLLGLWSFRSGETVTKSKGSCSGSTTKLSVLCLVEFSYATVNKSLKETEADPAWVLSTIATRHGMS